MSQRVREALELVVAYFPCQCAFPGLRPPPSPALSAQEGELQGLLGDELDWREDDIDALSLHSTRPASSKYRLKPKHVNGPYPAKSLHDDRHEYEVNDVEDEFEVDPETTGQETIEQLSELARRFEPGLTIEQMAQEEEEQAERERIARKASLSRQVIQEPRMGEDDDFGGFEEAPPLLSPQYTDPLGVDTESPTDEDRNDSEISDRKAAEAPSGLGNGSENE